MTIMLWKNLFNWDKDDDDDDDPNGDYKTQTHARTWTHTHKLFCFKMKTNIKFRSKWANIRYKLFSICSITEKASSYRFCLQV